MFPFHRVAIAGNGRIPHVYDVKLDKPMSPSATRRPSNGAEKAGLTLRFYDARHSFVTRLAENPAVSEETIRQLAGHVSPRMLGRYAHIRAQARRDAIATLERQPPFRVIILRRMGHKIGHSQRMNLTRSIVDITLKCLI